MDDTPPEQQTGARWRSGPCSNTLDGSLTFPACRLLVATGAVHRTVHGRPRSSGRSQVPRTQRNVPMDTWPQVPAPAAPPHNRRTPWSA